MKLIDKILSGVFTSYEEYIKFKLLRDTIVAIDPKGSSKYLSTLDAEEEGEIDSIIQNALAIKSLKGELSREYCNGVLDAFEARRALIRKTKRQE